ncbi:hypothetical protein GCM10010187_45410 [Actinomadura coerulea]|nr:hypothetical protein GCM10010187_45410 [Actinomadura coerulea]
MSAPSLTERRPPWVVFTTGDDPWVAAETTALQEQGGLVFRLDGRELLEPASLFRAFAQELGFLDYFGHNWDALVDCLHDWHGPGHGRQDVAVLVDSADELSGAEFLGLLVSVLCQARPTATGCSWPLGAGRNRLPPQSEREPVRWQSSATRASALAQAGEAPRPESSRKTSPQQAVPSPVR